jgi:hypothetical protein
MAITVARTREELYEDVWSQPMLTLARRYGMSDRGLAKLCSRHMLLRTLANPWAVANST